MEKSIATHARAWLKRANTLMRKKPPHSTRSWPLTSLTPTYLADEHRSYVNAIIAALADDNIRNIALSGPYGVGKSSILKEVTRQREQRVVELSLSTLAPLHTVSDDDTDDTLPAQATTPTNRIQQEIVKQLLYRENPKKTPDSRFQRIERFRWGRAFTLAALTGFLATLFSLLMGWTKQVDTALTIPGKNALWGHLIVWVVSSVITISFYRLFHGKLRIKQLSAGSATVTLDETSISYFDQYLDEIVYFFEMSQRDIVIFEDIDRFNDAHIFETLLTLNNLLNNAPQIKQPIRFIYAIKDSIFGQDHLTSEERDAVSKGLIQAEAIHANRTKFFDLIIPVVPFITHRNSRNLAMQLLAGIKHEVSPALLDLAVRYLPDMRLLKNVRNEFIIFRDRIFSGDGKHLKLNENELFAMMLYKSTHLQDFEKIRLGTSSLDELYQRSREFIRNSIQSAEEECAAYRHTLERINGVTARSARLGEKLDKFIKQLDNSEYNDLRTRIKNTSNYNIRSVEFWNDVALHDGDKVIVWVEQTYQRNILQFTKETLATILGDPLDAESWNEEDRNEIPQKIQKRKRDISFLQHADFHKLIHRSDLHLKREGKKQRSFDTITKKILGRGLAYRLVAAGYITRNFTLYTSKFYGNRVSSNAMNFIIHHVDRGLMDEQFVLSEHDVEAVMRECGESALKNPALYNISILEHLLHTEPQTADIMIQSLTDLGEPQTLFLQAYLSSEDTQRLSFIARFTNFSSRTLITLINHIDLDDTARLELVNQALAHLNSLTQQIEPPVTDYLLAHYAEFDALTSDKTDASLAEKIAALYDTAHIKVPRLEPLSALMRSAFIARNLYEITTDTLTTIVGPHRSIALDKLRDTHEPAYHYILDHLDLYVGAMHGHTIDNPNDFMTIISEVCAKDDACLDPIIKNAAPDCQITDITELPLPSWPILARNERFSATWHNITQYSGELSIDAPLACVLHRSTAITDSDDADNAQKTALALKLLAARDQLPSAQHRVALVKSLALEHPLDVGDIPVESDALFALLLEEGLITDDAHAYSHLSETDWPTREDFIAASQKFVDYMTPELIGADLTQFLQSDKIEPTLKQVICENIALYAQDASLENLKALAHYASHYGAIVPPEIILKIAQEEDPTDQEFILSLLHPQIGTIEREALFSLLHTLGSQYTSLTECGHDKPTIPNTPTHQALLERLKKEDIVSSYKANTAQFRVHKKHQ